MLFYIHIGIDVTYEVQSRNQPRQRHCHNGGHCGEGHCTGHPGPRGFGMLSGACPQVFHSQCTNISSENTSEKSEEKTTAGARDADLVTITDSTLPSKVFSILVN